MDSPLAFARAACDTVMRRYAAEDLPPKGHFHYHQGVFLSGMLQTWQLCGEEAYLTYARDWIDSVFDRDGRILNCSYADLDDIQPGILLFPLWDRTGDAFYLECLRSVYAEVQAVPRNSLGGFWHKCSLKDQMWLDGLYMAGPFCAEYAKRFDLPALREDVVKQALLMERVTGDPATGLLYHAWDGAGEAAWADPETGRSPEFWGRSMGWVPVALLNDLDFMEPGQPGYADLARMAADLLRALCRWQSEDGRWYQVVNRGGEENNWLENSCSCLYVAGLCKAVRKGLLAPEWMTRARRGYEGVIRSLGREGDDLLIGQVCVGTGVGDYAFYCARPTSVNDLHGVGAFLLMCTELEQCIRRGL